jgi:hypothetical protein
MVLSWGRGEDGQLGHGDAEDRQEPQAVFSLINRGATAVHCGAEYSLAVAGDTKQVYSWGWGDFGRLGTGDVKDVFIPYPLPALAGRHVAAVACGDTHTLVTTADGELYAFGRNQNGQCGLGSIQDCLVPQLVTALQVGRGAAASVPCPCLAPLTPTCCTPAARCQAWAAQQPDPCPASAGQACRACCLRR